MKRLPMAPPKENQSNQQRNAIESERKVCELTSLKRNKQGKQQQTIRVQPAEKSFNQQLKDTARSSKI